MDLKEYEIYLSFNNGAEGWQIPINPESIEVREDGQGKTYDIIGQGGGTDETRAGEINVIKSPRLKEVSFSSIFPALPADLSSPHHLVLSGVTHFEPMYYIRFIRKWMESKHPIRFKLIGYNSQLTAQFAKEVTDDINFPASIESFEWKEVAGSPGDIEYTIKLKEYVFYSARRTLIGTLPNGETVLYQQPPDRPDERIRPETYTLKEGDNLPLIAMRFYNMDSSRHLDIQKLNGITDAQTKSLQPGLVIKLPRE
jgi:hypothetical protein